MQLASTGSEDLDGLLGGGIPYGAVMLIAGNPGTGKTTLAAKIIYEGLRRGEPGLYISFVEPRQDFMEHMHSLGMDFKRYEEEGLFSYEELLFILDEEALENQLSQILQTVIEKGVRRLAIDSVTALLQLVNDKSRVREMLQNFFVRGVKQVGAISLLIAEHPYGARTVGYGVEEFVVDAVVILRFQIVDRKMQRTIEVRKLRWAPIRIAEAPFYIKPGVVVDVRLPEPLENMPPLDLTRAYSLAEAYSYLIRAGLIKVPLSKRVVRMLEATLSIPRGSQVMVTVSPTVGTRLLAAMSLAGLLRRHPSLTVAMTTLRSSPHSILSLLRCILRAVGCKKTEETIRGRIRVLSMNPTAFTLFELTDLLRGFVEETRPDILLLEGGEILNQLYPQRELAMAMYNTMVFNKMRKVTAFYLFTVSSRQEALQLQSLYISDTGVYISTAPRSFDTALAGGAMNQLTIEVFSSLGHYGTVVTLDTEKLVNLGCIA